MTLSSFNPIRLVLAVALPLTLSCSANVTKTSDLLGVNPADIFSVEDFFQIVKNYTTAPSAKEKQLESLQLNNYLATVLDGASDAPMALDGHILFGIKATLKNMTGEVKAVATGTGSIAEVWKKLGIATTQPKSQSEVKDFLADLVDSYKAVPSRYKGVQQASRSDGVSGGYGNLVALDFIRCVTRLQGATGSGLNLDTADDPGRPPNQTDSRPVINPFADAAGRGFGPPPPGQAGQGRGNAQGTGGRGGHVQPGFPGPQGRGGGTGGAGQGTSLVGVGEGG